MRAFTYERAGSVEEALGLYGEETRYLGGGTNLVDLMRLGVERPARIVDVSRLPFDRIEERPGGGLLVGAGVRNSDLAAHPAVRRDHPMLARAVLSGASGQIRNQATVGGNLLQRTRCSYFQDPTKPCNKREPGTGCPAIEGEHHNLAILGHSEGCVATHPSDMAVALVASDAVVHLKGRGGERSVPLTDLYRFPGNEPERDTTLEPGELVTGVEVPPLPMPAAYRKVRERASFAFALVSIAAAAEVSGGTVRDCRIALGGVAHRPWRALKAEDVLRGERLTEENLIRAAGAELEAARPLRDNAYKLRLVRNLIVRTMLDLGERA